MKKLALILGLLSIFSIIRPAYAQNCRTGTICTGDYSVSCYVDFASGNKCCATQQDCDTYKNASLDERKEFEIQNQIVEPKIEDLCKYAGEKSGECMSCFGGGEAWTAIGCIPTSPSGFMERFLSLGIGLAGGIAFLLIIFSGFQMLTSVGNPEKLNAGKELLTSAISGLILIIFSIFLLRLIGVDILGLPEFK